MSKEDEAYHLLIAAYSDYSLSPRDRSEVCAMLGDLVQRAPRLGVLDECGYSWYLQSIALDRDNPRGWLGVVAGFGSKFPDHQDRETTQRAIEVLAALRAQGALSLQQEHTLAALQAQLVLTPKPGAE